MCVLARGVGVVVPETSERGRAVVWAWVKGVGSITRVRFGKGELGSEGGSWMGAGVEVSSLDILELWVVGMGIVCTRRKAVKGGGVSRRVACLETC